MEAFTFTEDAFFTVAWVDVCVVVQDEELALHITEELLEVLGAGGVAGATGEKGVAAEKVLAPDEGGSAGGVAGVVDGPEGDIPEGEGALVFQVLISLDGKFTFVIWVDYQGYAEGVLEGLGAIDMVEVGVSE